MIVFIIWHFLSVPVCSLTEVGVRDPSFCPSQSVYQCCFLLLQLFHRLIHIHFGLILSLWNLSTLIWRLIFQFIESNISLGSWVRWRCWLSVQSWWRGWWSPGPFALRGPTRFGYVRTGRGRRCWWMTCCPAMTMATSSFPRLEECGEILRETPPRILQKPQRESELKDTLSYNM